MANRNAAGFGMIPSMRVGNTPSIQGQSKYEIAAGYATAMYQGDPVRINVSATVGGYVVSAIAGTAMVGVLNGVFYTAPTTLKPTFQNFYTQVTPGNTETITAFVNDDPFQEYLMATNATLGTTVALRQSKVGLTYATSASSTAGSGASSISLDISSAATTAKQLRLVRVAEDPENQDETVAFCSVIVKVNLSQYVVGSLATGI
jgi:hypothetical protein